MAVTSAVGRCCRGAARGQERRESRAGAGSRRPPRGIVLSLALLRASRKMFTDGQTVSKVPAELRKGGLKFERLALKAKSSLRSFVNLFVQVFTLY